MLRSIATTTALALVMSASALAQENDREDVTLYRVFVGDHADPKITAFDLGAPDNRWTFEPAGDAQCDVKFFIDYEFKSRTLGLLMGSMFDFAFRRFAEAFERRADEIYGPNPN